MTAGPAVPGLRATRQRAAVAALLESTDEFRSAQDLHEQLRRDGQGIGSAGHLACSLAVGISETGGNRIGNGGVDRRNFACRIIAGLRHRSRNTYH